MHVRTQPIDDLFDVLSNQKRRRLLVTLLRRDAQATLRVPEDLSSEGPTDRLALEMYHVHLPRLETMGFIEWDRRTNSVERGPTFEDFRPLLSALDQYGEELSPRWP